MKIVIDIPEEDYKFIKDLQFYNSGRRSGKTIERNVINGIKNGKPYEERPIGHWKDHRWCSNCGCGIPTDVYGTSITEEEAHFCVECGARMEAGNEVSI